jgi:monoamine oxidase
MQQVVDSNRPAVTTGLAALRGLDDIDFRAMVHSSKDKGQAAKEAMRQMTQVVPLVYWHHLFETFLKEWSASEYANPLHSAPTERTRTQAVEAS